MYLPAVGVNRFKAVCGSVKEQQHLSQSCKNSPDEGLLTLTLLHMFWLESIFLCSRYLRFIPANEISKLKIILIEVGERCSVNIYTNFTVTSHMWCQIPLNNNHVDVSQRSLFYSAFVLNVLKYRPLSVLTLQTRRSSAHRLAPTLEPDNKNWPARK